MDIIKLSSFERAENNFWGSPKMNPLFQSPSTFQFSNQNLILLSQNFLFLPKFILFYQFITKRMSVKNWSINIWVSSLGHLLIDDDFERGKILTEIFQQDI